MRNKTYLVTGSAGFIGFFVSKRLLEAGYDVVGVDNLNDYYDVKLKKERNKILLRKSPGVAGGGKYTFIKKDISKIPLTPLKGGTVPQIDCIIHLAAQAGVRYSMQNPLAYAQTNYIGTMNILEFAKKQNIKKVIYASSSSVYGNSVPPYSEEFSNTNTPISVYAATKKATESLAHTYTHLYKIDTVGLRFFTVYGRWSRPDMATLKFARDIIRGKEITLYAKGELKRGFTHIDDIVDGVLAAEKLSGYNIVNLGGNELVVVNTLVKLLEKFLEKKAKIKYLPMQAGDVPETKSVQTLAKEKISFFPKKNFEEGIKDFCAWVLENQKLLVNLKDSKQ